MSRYTVTVKTDGETDENAVIGYDPPLRTFFLQAFPMRKPTNTRCGSGRFLSNTKALNRSSRARAALAMRLRGSHRMRSSQ